MSTLPDGSLLDSIPFLHNGDSYIIRLRILNEKNVAIHDILLYPDNTNCEPTSESFQDLDLVAKRLTIQQINRKHPGKMVKV